MLFSSMAGGTAFGAHPLITDDTGTQGKGKFQLELNGEISRDEETLDGIDAREDAGELTISISVGVAEGVDAIVGFPWVYSRLEENGSPVSEESGPGDMSLEMKWRFLSRKGFSLAVKPGVTIPTGDEEKGLGNGKPSYSLTLIASQDWEKFFLHVNGAYTRNEYKLDVDRKTNRSDIWHASVAAGVHVTESMQVVGNIGAESNGDRTSSRWPSFLLGGVIYSITERLDVDLGVKTGLNGPEPDLAVLAGIAWRI